MAPAAGPRVVGSRRHGGQRPEALWTHSKPNPLPNDQSRTRDETEKHERRYRAPGRRLNRTTARSAAVEKTSVAKPSPPDQATALYCVGTSDLRSCSILGRSNRRRRQL
jgi:hypothetical protein